MLNKFRYKQHCLREIAINFLSIRSSLNMCFGAQKNRLIETVLLCTKTYVLVEKYKNDFQIRTVIWRPLSLSLTYYMYMLMACLTHANILGPDQARQDVGSDLDPNCSTLMVFMK